MKNIRKNTKGRRQMPARLPIKKTESVSTKLEQMHDRIMKRAFELSNLSGQGLGKDVDDWLAAERELVWKPPVVLTEKNNEFRLRIAAPGVNPRDIDIEVTPECLLVKTETNHESREDRGHVHASEFECRNLFRLIQFPRIINPDKVKVEFENGVLQVNAVIAA
jgi:HSP20 family molecular chaperone IbpA